MPNIQQTFHRNSSGSQSSQSSELEETLFQNIHNTSTQTHPSRLTGHEYSPMDMAFDGIKHLIGFAGSIISNFLPSNDEIENQVNSAYLKEWSKQNPLLPGDNEYAAHQRRELALALIAAQPKDFLLEENPSFQIPGLGEETNMNLLLNELTDLSIETSHSSELNSILHTAIKRDSSHALKALLVLMPNLCVEGLNKQGDTPLLYAARLGQLKCLKILAEKDPAEINNQNEFGGTAAFYAALNGHKECLLALHKAGADIEFPLEPSCNHEIKSLLTHLRDIPNF